MLPKTCQTVLFSATFPPNVIAYANRFAPNANVLTLAHEDLTIEGIKQLYIDIDKDNDKFATLLKFYGLMTQASSIIFVRTRKTAEQLEQRMVAEGHKVAQLSGGLEGPDRDRIIDQFRSGEAKVLITTNVLARGIDVQSVTMVINYVSRTLSFVLCVILTLFRTFPPWLMALTRTLRHTCTASVVPDDLDVSVSLSHSCTTSRAGRS
jgi:ATP-dependent RNA helicase DDX19/DBP5